MNDAFDSIEKKDSKEKKGSKRKDTRGVIVLLEEIQEVLDHADDPHFDTATNARFLASKLDSLKYNDMAFILSTCNGDEYFSSQMKGRYKGNIIFFKSIEAPNERLVALHEHIRRSKIILDDSCDDAFLISQMQALSGWVGRDFEVLVTSIVNAFLDDDGDLDQIVVSKDQVLRGIKEMQEAVAHAKKEKPETAQQQAERLHRESLSAQLKMASRQKGQMTAGVSVTGNVSKSVGIGGCQASSGVSVGGSVSRSSAPGLDREVAADIYRETFGEELDDSGAGAGAEEVKPSMQGPIRGKLIYWSTGGHLGRSFATNSTTGAFFK